MSIFSSPSFDVGFELLDECYLDEGEKGFLWLWPDY
jgi:hypothetical protein